MTPEQKKQLEQMLAGTAFAPPAIAEAPEAQPSRLPRESYLASPTYQPLDPMASKPRQTRGSIDLSFNRQLFGNLSPVSGETYEGAGPRTPWSEQFPQFAARLPTTDDLWKLEAEGKLFDPETNRPLLPLTKEFQVDYRQGKARQNLMGSYQAAIEVTAGTTSVGLSSIGINDPFIKTGEIADRAAQLRKEGYGFFEANRMAWQQTDMASARLHLIWGYDFDKNEFVQHEIPLWGDHTFGGIDVGVKGAIEFIADPAVVFGGLGKGVSVAGKLANVATKKTINIARKETLDAVIDPIVIKGLKESDIDFWMNGNRIITVEKPRTYVMPELQARFDEVAMLQKKTLDNLEEAGLIRKGGEFTYERIVDPTSAQGLELLEGLGKKISNPPETVGNQKVGALRDFTDVTDEVISIEQPIIRALAEKLGINPSAAATSPVAKAVIAHARQVVSSDELIEVALITNLDSLANRFTGGLPVKIDGEGFVEGTGRLWNDVFAEPQKYKNKLSDKALEYIDNYNQLVDEADRLRDASGLRALGKGTEDGWYYVPRMVRDIDGIKVNRTSPKLQRVYDEATEGFENGVRYDVDPRATLKAHMRGTYRDIIEKQMSDHMEPLSVTTTELIDKGLRDAMTIAIKKRIASERNLRKLRNRMRVLTVGRTAPPTGRGVRTAEQTVRTARGGERAALQQQINDAQKLFDDAVVEYNSVKNKYNSAKKQADKSAIGEGALFGKSEGNISISKWRNRFFPQEDATLLREGLGEFGYSREDLGFFTKNFTKLTNTVRFLASVGDFAAPFIQGLPLLVSNPVKWGRATGNHYWAFADPTAQARFVSKNVETFQEMARYGIPIGDSEFFAAMNAGEGFQAGKILEHLPKGASARKLIRSTQRQSFGRFQSSYNMFLTMNRALLWDGMKKSWIDNGGTRSELAAYIRNLTGALDSKTLGVGPRQRAAESAWLAFSPKLLRSTIAVVADAARGALPGATMRQRESIKLMGKMIAGIGGLYVTSGIAMGKSEEQILEGLNPLNGGRFLSHEVGGQWIGVGGQYRALLQFMTNFASAVGPGGEEISALRSPSILDNPILQFISYRGAPGLNIAGGALEGITQGKADVLPFDDIDSIPDIFTHIGTSALPFALQGVLEGDNWKSAAFGGVGFRSRTLSPADEVRLLRKEQLDLRGIDLDWNDENLDLRIKQEIDAMPKLQEALEEREVYYSERGSEYQATKNEEDAIDTEFEDLLTRAYEQLGPGKEFTDRQKQLYATRTTRKSDLQEREDYKRSREFFAEKDAATYGFNVGLEAYGDALFDETLEDPVTGEYNYDERERRIENLQDKFGTDMVTAIEQYFYQKQPQVVRDFKDDMEIMRPYFEIGGNVAKKYGYVKEWEEYMNTDSTQRSKVRKFTPQIQFLLEQIELEKEQFLLTNLEASVKLWKWEYVSSDNPVNPTLFRFIKTLEMQQGGLMGVINDRSQIDNFLEQPAGVR